ncbi:MAG: phytoene/squalene synthase family protein [Proteobacteria bacterium]|nr:phytoene/squalene synthase family protein [Pseudomonadota bacterium]
MIAAADRAACAATLRTGSRSFAMASLFLPERVRAPATALYAFCRAADDAIDLSDDRAAALAMLRSRLGRIYAGAPSAAGDAPGDAVDRAFAAVVTDFALPRALPEALLEGFAWDVEARRYDDLAALIGYAMRVAGTVGVMMALLMGTRDARMLSAACDLGCGMQLTNIARDVGEDARAGRLYLPLSWLREEAIDPEAWLAAPAFTPALGRVVARLLAEAECLYARAEPGIARLPARCRPAIRAARRLYGGIGDAVAQAGYNSVSGRATVPMARKLMLLSGCVAGPKGALLPPDPAGDFLIGAVWPGPSMVNRPAPWQQVDDRIGWVVELFARLNEMERVHGRPEPSTADRTAEA